MAPVRGSSVTLKKRFSRPSGVTRRSPRRRSVPPARREPVRLVAQRRDILGDEHQVEQLVLLELPACPALRRIRHGGQRAIQLDDLVRDLAAGLVVDQVEGLVRREAGHAHDVGPVEGERVEDDEVSLLLFELDAAGDLPEALGQDGLGQPGRLVGDSGSSRSRPSPGSRPPGSPCPTCARRRGACCRRPGRSCRPGRCSRWSARRWSRPSPPRAAGRGSGG